MVGLAGSTEPSRRVRARREEGGECVSETGAEGLGGAGHRKGPEPPPGRERVSTGSSCRENLRRRPDSWCWGAGGRTEMEFVLWLWHL